MKPKRLAEGAERAPLARHKPYSLCNAERRGGEKLYTVR